MPLGARAAVITAETVAPPAFQAGSFFLGVLCTLALVACYALQRDADPYLFDAPVGECVRDSAHRKKR